MNHPFAELLTTKQLCEAVGITRQTLQAWKVEGRAVPVAQVGEHPTAPCFWDPADVARLKESKGQARS